MKGLLVELPVRQGKTTTIWNTINQLTLYQLKFTKTYKNFAFASFSQPESTATVQSLVTSRNSCRIHQWAQDESSHHMHIPINIFVPRTVMAVSKEKRCILTPLLPLFLVLPKAEQLWCNISSLPEKKIILIVFNYSNVSKFLTSDFSAALILSISLSLELDTCSSVAASERKGKIFSFISQLLMCWADIT